MLIFAQYAIAVEKNKRLAVEKFISDKPIFLDIMFRNPIIFYEFIIINQMTCIRKNCRKYRIFYKS